MIFRRLSPFVAVAFLAAHVAACACTASMNTPAKKEAHSCCSKESAPSPKAPPPHEKSCCCSDGTHLAVAEEQEPVTSAQTAVAVTAQVLPPKSAEACPDLIIRPPGRPAPDVPLDTLFSTLLI